MMSALLLQLALLINFSSGLLLDNEGEQRGAAKVLVFGDSWGESGPSWVMLDKMLAAHGVAAVVRNAAIGGTRACQWSEDPWSIPRLAKDNFPKMNDKGESLFVWYTLGGNDLLDEPYLSCQRRSKTFREAAGCLAVQTAKVVGCSRVLLRSLFTALPKTRVVQCGYDLSCVENECNPVVRFPFCGKNATCSNHQFMVWQPMLLDSFNREFRTNYVGINIAGAEQVAAGVPGASVGHPVLEKGSPCSMQFGCVHPVPDSAAADAIGEQFWEQFFKARVTPGQQAATQKLPGEHHLAPALALAAGRCLGDVERLRTACMWSWSPLDANTSLVEECSLESVLRRAGPDRPEEQQRRVG
mmetsp:Transcript_40637/g.115046  ORF Transcript_40637/g.115046 Transcript_40637/m.115046 type:complete len:356 (+) Transcript_40637:118-1185(+)